MKHLSSMLTQLQKWKAYLAVEWQYFHPQSLKACKTFNYNNKEPILLLYSDLNASLMYFCLFPLREEAELGETVEIL
jgi:hypothetical protein